MSVVTVATLYLVGKARAVVRVRGRSIVIRVDVHETVVRIRSVARASDDTPRGSSACTIALQRYIFSPFFQYLCEKKQAADAALAESEQPLQALTLSLCRSALFLLNELDCASEGKPRAEAGVRVRSIVIRADAHEAEDRVRVVAGAKNTTPRRGCIP